jgi:hypothetical protein
MQQTKNLDSAKLRAAKYGMDIPIRILNEISSYEERISTIKQELE